MRQSVLQMPIRIIVLALVQVSCGPPTSDQGHPASAPSTAATPPLVTMRFDWPDEFTADVSAERRYVRRGTTADSGQVTLSFVRTVTSNATSFVVRHHSVEIPTTLSGDRRAEVVMEMLAGLTPSFRVSRDAEFLEVIDQASFRQQLENIYSELLPAATPNERRQFLTSLESENLGARSAERWVHAVDQWGEGILRQGLVLDLDGDVVEVLPGVNAPEILRFTLIRIQPCQIDLPDGCAEVSLSAVPHPDSLPLIIQRLPDERSSDSLISVASRIGTEVVVFTHPSSLLPFKITTKKTSPAVSRSGERSSLTTDEYVETVTFRYRLN
jgi:hypothetical protein